MRIRHHVIRFRVKATEYLRYPAARQAHGCTALAEKRLFCWSRTSYAVRPTWEYHKNTALAPCRWGRGRERSLVLCAICCARSGGGAWDAVA